MFLKNLIYHLSVNNSVNNHGTFSQVFGPQLSHVEKTTQNPFRNNKKQQTLEQKSLHAINIGLFFFELQLESLTACP